MKIEQPSLLYQKFLNSIFVLGPKSVQKGAIDVQKIEGFFTSTIIALIVMPAYGTLYNFLGEPVAANFCWIATLVVFLNALFFRIFASLSISREVLIITIYFLLIGLTYRLGGVQAPTVIWFVLCPAAVISSGDRKQALFWSTVVFLTVIGIYISDMHGFYPLPIANNMRLLGVISIISLLITITVVVTIFEQISSRAFSRLDNAIENIRQEKEKAQVTLQSIGDAVITTDAEMIIDYLNPIAENSTGWTTATAKGLHMDTVFRIFNEKTGLAAVNPIKECLERNGIVEMENHTILVRNKDNEEFHIEDSAAPIRRPDGSIIGAVMVFHDVTDRKVAQTRLQHIAFHDSLTSLPNRALFAKKLAESIESACVRKHKVAVLFLDLDRFKIINDSLGHGIGDELLIAVARRLRQCIRENDVVCRMGGDEFTAVLNKFDSVKNVSDIAEKIINAISSPFNIQEHVLRVSTSIGITFYPNDGETAEVLLKNADSAMYSAKENGRGNYRFYDAIMREEADSKWQLENALHSALENQEFFLEYQPKIDLAQNKIVGGEALLRWQSPMFGRIMPNDFIPKLEDSGAIIPVGTWVLESAIKQAKQWLDHGNSIVVSVNVSARQFKHENLTEIIKTLLDKAKLPAELLQLEITESLLMDDAERSEIIIRDLRNLGVKVSLDDFGTGYSSLSYLRRFSIDELKIDRSFVVEIESNETALKIVETVVALGQALGMKVIAEGVETETQKVYLKNIGCDEIQGYVISRPLTEHAFNKFISSSNSV